MFKYTEHMKYQLEMDLCSALSEGFGNKRDIISLLQCGVDINNQTFGFTPLTQAVEMEDYQLVKLLLEYGADANKMDEDDHTPVKCAAEAGNLEIFTLLMEYKANIYSKDAYGNLDISNTTGELKDYLENGYLLAGLKENC